MKEMKTLTFPNGAKYEVVDAKARQDIGSLKESIVEEVGGDTLTWDGNTEGLVSTPSPSGEIWYKVSDNVITMNDLSQGSSVTMGDISADLTEYLYDTGDGVIIFDVGAFFSETIEGVPKGIYLAQGVSSLTINGYTGFTQTKIKEELLPESVKSLLYYVKINEDEDGNAFLEGGSYEEARQIIENGGFVKGLLYGGTESVMVNLEMMGEFPVEFYFQLIDGGNLVFLKYQLTSNGVEMVDMLGVQLTSML